MEPDVVLMFWGDDMLTDWGLNVNLALSVWFDSHSCNPGTTPVANLLVVVATMWKVLPAANVPMPMPPEPSPVSLIQTWMLLL
jgi:hypothetical protein